MQAAMQAATRGLPRGLPRGAAVETVSAQTGLVTDHVGRFGPDRLLALPDSSGARSGKGGVEGSSVTCHTQ
jgi:hypothetical protein